MTIKEPLNLAAAHRAHFYDNILLYWECGGRGSLKKFDAKKIEIQISSSLKIIRDGIYPSINCKKEYFYFAHSSKFNGHDNLLYCLRNIIAHGCYRSPKRGWIEIEHEYQGKLKVRARMRIEKLRKLVDLAINI